MNLRGRFSSKFLAASLLLLLSGVPATAAPEAPPCVRETHTVSPTVSVLVTVEAACGSPFLGPTGVNLGQARTPLNGCNTVCHEGFFVYVHGVAVGGSSRVSLNNGHNEVVVLNTKWVDCMSYVFWCYVFGIKVGPP